MVETRDEETGEIVKQLVDKVRRHKVTRLKKTILAARANRELVRKDKVPRHKEPTDSGFESVSSDEEEVKELSSPVDERADMGSSIFGDLSIL